MTSFLGMIMIWRIRDLMDNTRGFKVFYNRRYFLNVRRYIKN